MYYAKIKWYVDYEDSEHVSHIMVSASSFKQAMEYIEREFDDIIAIELEQLNAEDTKCIYLPDDCIEAVKNENIF